MRTFNPLHLGVLFVGFEAALRLEGVVVSVEAKQQCRLQIQPNNKNQVPSSPIIIGTGTSATGRPPTSTSPGSYTTLPSSTPFNYGTEPIRGVNLYVVYCFSRDLINDSNQQRWMVCPRGTYTSQILKENFVTN